MSQGFEPSRPASPAFSTMSLPSDSPQRIPADSPFDALATAPLVTADVACEPLPSPAPDAQRRTSDDSNCSESLFPNAVDENLGANWINVFQSEYRKSPFNVFITLPETLNLSHSVSSVDGNFYF